MNWRAGCSGSPVIAGGGRGRRFDCQKARRGDLTVFDACVSDSLVQCSGRGITQCAGVLWGCSVLDGEERS
jgi:hypothetical protein